MDESDGSARIPPPPEIRPAEWQSWAILLDVGKRLSLGWQARPARKGGQCYVVGRNTLFGEPKVIARFPATESGWADAWQYLVNLDPAGESYMRAALDARFAKQRAKVATADLDARTQVRLRYQSFLGGYAAELNLTPGDVYDLSFTDEDLVVTVPRGWPPLLTAPYHQIEELEITGPGQTSVLRPGQQFVLDPAGGFLTTRTMYGSTSIQTFIKVRMPDCELYFQNTSTLPDILRMQLSRQLAAIRDAHVQAARSVVAELKDLTAMLDAGLLTREEFDQMKKRLLDP